MLELIENIKKRDLIKYYIDGYGDIDLTYLFSCLNQSDIEYTCKHFIKIAAHFNKLADIRIILHNNNQVDLDIAMYIACEKGHKRIVKFLLKNGANINSKTNHPIEAALIGNHLDILDYLISVGANIHFNNEYFLNLMIQYGKYKMVKELIKRGANVNCLYRNILYTCVQYRKFKILKYIIQHGGNIDRIINLFEKIPPNLLLYTKYYSPINTFDKFTKIINSKYCQIIKNKIIINVAKKLTIDTFY